jgi:hypothetical protein
MLLDQELRFKEHVAYAVRKGTLWLDQFRRVARPSKGLSTRHMRHFYLAVAVPRMLYAADVFLIPPRKSKRGTKGIVAQLAHVQRRAALHTTGAMRTTPTDLLDAHADLLPFELLVDKKCHTAALRLATLPASHPLHYTWVAPPTGLLSHEIRVLISWLLSLKYAAIGASVIKSANSTSLMSFSPLPSAPERHPVPDTAGLFWQRTYYSCALDAPL